MMKRIIFLWLVGSLFTPLVAVPVSAQTLSAPMLYAQCEAPLTEQPAQTAAIGKASAMLQDSKANDAAKRAAAAAALAKTCDPRATEPLLSALKSGELSVRLAAAEALGKLGDRAALEPMIELLDGLDVQKDAELRGALALTFGSFPVQMGRNATLNLIVNPGGNKVMTAAEMRARCLGVLVVNQMLDVRFSRKAIGFLFEFLDHNDPNLRQIAEQTARELKQTRNGLHELLGILKQHNYPPFRRKAAYWLGEWQATQARGALAEAAIGDRDASVQQAAKQALAQLK